MRIPHQSKAVRTLVAGACCLSILAGMIVGHAWPLWTGETVLLRARPVDPRDLFRGEFVRLDTPASRLLVGSGARTTPADAIPVRGIGEWAGAGSAGAVRRGKVVFVQFERRECSPEHGPVSISNRAVDGALNLRGRVRHLDGDGVVLVDYGLDAFYMQEGTAAPVERALAERRLVQMQVAVAASGRARIRTLLVDGRAIDKE